ncbi:MAG: hypothetical protein EA397_00925 [Deltaproteobacteria bacterium]|nr:MAG: hypothetical protein EA397_00925 [Deltaproteobacteria bacterium]
MQPLDALLPLRYRPLWAIVVVLLGLAALAMVVAVLVEVLLEGTVSTFLEDEEVWVWPAASVLGLALVLGGLWALRAGTTSLEQTSSGLRWRQRRQIYHFPASAIRRVVVVRNGLRRAMAYSQIYLDIDAPGVPVRLFLGASYITGAGRLLRANRLARALRVPFVDPLGRAYRRGFFLMRWTGESRVWILVGSLCGLGLSAFILSLVLSSGGSPAEWAAVGVFGLLGLLCLLTGLRRLPIVDEEPRPGHLRARIGPPDRAETLTIGVADQALVPAPQAPDWRTFDREQLEVLSVELYFSDTRETGLGLGQLLRAHPTAPIALHWAPDPEARR